MKKNKFNKWKLIVFLVVIALVLIGIIIYPYFKFTEIKWCNFEKNITDVALSRNECAHIKIISKNMDIIQFDKFLELNATSVGCYNSYSELPACYGDEFYFTELDFQDFIDTDDKGTICTAYYVTYYEINDTFYLNYKDAYIIQNFDREMSDVEDLIDRFKNCEVD